MVAPTRQCAGDAAGPGTIVSPGATGAARNVADPAMSPAGPQPLLRSRLPGDVVLDGELVIWDAGRRAAGLRGPVPRRIVAGRRIATVAAAHPAHYIVFDLLGAEDVDLRGLPLTERRGRLERLMRNRQDRLRRLPVPRRQGPAQRRAAGATTACSGRCVRVRTCRAAVGARTTASPAAARQAPVRELTAGHSKVFRQGPLRQVLR